MRFRLACSAAVLALLCGVPRRPASADPAAAATGEAVQAPVTSPDGQPAHHAAHHRHGRHRTSRAEHPAAAHSGAVASHAAPSDAELAVLRSELAQKLRALNAPSPPAPVPSADGTAAGEAADNRIVTLAVPPRPTCPPTFDTRGWTGSGAYSDRLRNLRGAVAATQAAPPALAALAEFYLAHGLAGEALDVIGEMPEQAADAAGQARLRMDADLARLLKGAPIDSASPLLAVPAACERRDAALWRALAAAASHDPASVARDAAAAAAGLRGLPELILERLALRIADATDDPAAMRAVAAALRNTNDGDPTDSAARQYLLARIARADRDEAAERVALQAAAADPVAMPGLFARARLAELAPPNDLRSESELADVARVYRDDVFGQDVAAFLAERRLQQGDYAASLAMVETSVAPDGARRTESRGAVLAAHVLRLLLADPPPEKAPGAAERAALFLRYQGYVPPGAQGDDIRLAAARLMLALGMPATALDTLRLLSADGATAPQAVQMRARAEARAGDPQAALRMLQHLAPDMDVHRTAAEALARLGRFTDAAAQLDGLAGLDDRAQRASLLWQAQAWDDAARAYAELLRDTALPKNARRDAEDRYSLALALSGSQPDAAAPHVSDLLAASVIATLPDPTHHTPPVTALRAALLRARQVEKLLPQANTRQGS